MIDSVSVNMQDNPLDSNHRGPKRYTDEIDKLYPGYLVSLFQYAQKTAGAKAGFVVLTETMNLKSKVQSDDKPTLTLHHLQVYRWFVSKGGKETSPIEKPLDTPAHKQQRKEWVHKHYNTLANEDVVQLDEKWFYVTSRRCTI